MSDISYRLPFPAPFRQAFDAARDPYAARNALGITTLGGGGISDAPSDGVRYVRQNAAWVSGDTAYQPLDGDLTSLAGASSTNAIYYRSAANTWGPVTIGTGLSFSGGTLASTLAGGNVSNSGTPAANEWAQWTDATHIQGVATASMPFVAKTGDTMTGDLSIAKTNAGLSLNKNASVGEYSAIFGKKAGLTRWHLTLGDGIAETGSGNVGSDFQIGRYNDAGALVDSPLKITRSTGLTTLAGDLTISKSTPSLHINKSASGQNNDIWGDTNGAVRWILRLGNSTAESGSNAGSDFDIYAWNDAGSSNFRPVSIKRSSGTVALGGFTNGNIDVDQGGVSMRCASTGAVGIAIRGMTAAASNYAMYFLNAAAGNVGSITMNDTATTYATSSDVRLKDNIHDYTEGRATLDQIKIIQFNWKEDGSGGVGVSAQQAQPYYPVAVNAGSGDLGEEGFRPWGVDYSKYVPLLIQALQDAHRRIDALEAKLG